MRDRAAALRFLRHCGRGAWHVPPVLRVGMGLAAHRSPVLRVGMELAAHRSPVLSVGMG